MSTEIQADFDENGVGDSGDARDYPAVLISNTSHINGRTQQEAFALEHKRAQAIGVVLEHVAKLVACTHEENFSENRDLQRCWDCGAVRSHDGISPWSRPKLLVKLVQAAKDAGDAL